MNKVEKRSFDINDISKFVSPDPKLTTLKNH